jgi:hypothetical protein
LEKAKEAETAHNRKEQQQVVAILKKAHQN